MSGYTKGPWVAGDYDENGGYDCMSGGVEIRNTSSDSVIATLDVVDFGADTFEHKTEFIDLVVSAANLIAAAPMMYEALKEAHAFIADQYCDAESQALDGEYVSREARPLWDTICNAMAKAEGE